jgi:hypothetical protein
MSEVKTSSKILSASEVSELQKKAIEELDSRANSIMDKTIDDLNKMIIFNTQETIDPDVINLKYIDVQFSEVLDKSDLYFQKIYDNLAAKLAKIGFECEPNFSSCENSCHYSYCDCSKFRCDMCCERDKHESNCSRNELVGIKII